MAPYVPSAVRMSRIEPLFLSPHGFPQFYDRRIVGGVIFAFKNSLRWRDERSAYGSHKTTDNRFVRLSCLGVFNRIFTELAGRPGNRTGS